MNFKYLAAATGLVITMMSASLEAEAQDAATCPAGAADMILQVASQVPLVNDDTQLQNAFAYATQLPVACPDDAIVHYFAAATLLTISDKVDDPGAKFERLREASAAFMAYDAKADHETRLYSSDLVDASGELLVVEMHDESYKFLSEYLGPKVIWFEANGLFHDWVSSSARAAAAAPDQPCPYVRQDYAAAEAHGHYLGHSQTAPIFLENDRNPNPLGSIERIELLVSKCPDARRDIYFELARLTVLFADLTDAHGSPASENGYIDRALAAIGTYMSLSQQASDTATHRYGVVTRWKTEMLALKPEASD